MDINFDILEQCRQYFNGELSPAEARAMEDKIDSDEMYAYHWRVWQTLSQGVGQSMMPDKEWMKELQHKPATDPGVLQLEKMIATEKASLRRRIFLFIGLLILILAGFALLVWKPWQPADTTIEQNTPPRLQADDVGKDEEPLIGSTGISVLYDIEQKIYNAGSPGTLVERKHRVVNLQAHSVPELKYLFRTDTLVIYSDNANQFDRSSFDWITIQSDGRTEDYIKIKTDFYEIPGTKDNHLLERVSQEKSEMLSDLERK